MVRPASDRSLVDIAEYVSRKEVGGRAAYELSRYCLMDAIGCALQSSTECHLDTGATSP